jgi:hypothetical protein
VDLAAVRFRDPRVADEGCHLYVRNRPNRKVAQIPPFAARPHDLTATR